MEECDNVAREYFPQNWRGRTRSEQQELFDQMRMYLTQNELHKTYARKISCDDGRFEYDARFLCLGFIR
jgi:hypothetical protein